MTREELKEHCERQVQQFERIEKIMPVTPNDWKRYEEHKLILELLEQESDEDAVSRQTIRLKIADMPKYAYGKRSASIRHLKDFLKKELGENIIVTEDVCVGFEICLEYIREFVRSLPSVTPTHKKGEWVKTGQSFINPNKFLCYSCSECGGGSGKVKTKFCPNCGAEMESEEW